jgi:hypothetical protein
MPSHSDSPRARPCLRRPLRLRRPPRRQVIRTLSTLDLDGVPGARLAYILAAERLDDAEAEATSALYRLAAAENKPLAQLRAELGL